MIEGPGGTLGLPSTFSPRYANPPVPPGAAETGAFGGDTPEPEIGRAGSSGALERPAPRCGARTPWEEPARLQPGACRRRRAPLSWWNARRRITGTGRWSLDSGHKDLQQNLMRRGASGCATATWPSAGTGLEPPRAEALRRWCIRWSAGRRESTERPSRYNTVARPRGQHLTECRAPLRLLEHVLYAG